MKIESYLLYNWIPEYDVNYYFMLQKLHCVDLLENEIEFEMSTIFWTFTKISRKWSFFQYKFFNNSKFSYKGVKEENLKILGGNQLEYILDYLETFIHVPWEIKTHYIWEKSSNQGFWICVKMLAWKWHLRKKNLVTQFGNLENISSIKYIKTNWLFQRIHKYYIVFAVFTFSFLWNWSVFLMLKPFKPFLGIFIANNLT